MASQYVLKVVSDFAAAHSLRNYPGVCSRLHGHNWKVEVEVTATSLDEAGMGIDFKVIRSATRQVSELLDHRYLNEVEPFLDVSPTAENIAAFFYQRLGALLNNDRVRISTVTLWETERACVRYSET